MSAAISPILRPSASEPFDLFAAAVFDAVERGDVVVVDCSDLDVVSISTIRMLEAASRCISVVLTNASPVVCLLATAFDVAVQPRAHVVLEVPSAGRAPTSDVALLDELRDLVLARERLHDQTELRPASSPRTDRVLRRVATRIDAIVAALGVGSPDN
jgi:hypothetical protein